jgi:hypothetical protein
VDSILLGWRHLGDCLAGDGVGKGLPLPLPVPVRRPETRSELGELHVVQLAPKHVKEKAQVGFREGAHAPRTVQGLRLYFQRCEFEVGYFLLVCLEELQLLHQLFS